MTRISNTGQTVGETTDTDTPRLDIPLIQPDNGEESRNGACPYLSENTTPSESERPGDDWFLAIKRELHQQVIATLDIAALGTMGEEDLRAEVRRQVEVLSRSRADLLSLAERERLVSEVLDETFGLGPIETLMLDPEISDILINGPKTIYIERRGKLERTSVAFHDQQHVLQVVQRIVAKVGRRVDETCPMVDARLADGSRLNAIIHPLALDGPLVSIRRFGARPLMIEDLLNNGSIMPEIVQFLSACVEARINILISGGTGSGKTTLLNALSCYIPVDERVATIEDSAELQLQQPHVVRMETRPVNIEGGGEITSRDLVRNALRMRPDRIIVGECRGCEALDMLQAMNTGHEGSLTTIHANNSRDALSRLEMMVGMAGFDIPIWVIRKQVAASINIVVQVSRLVGGVRKVVNISEITGMEGEVLSMHDIFEFKQTGLNDRREAQGHFLATGIRPACLAKLEASGVELPGELFQRKILDN
jgi:pilus assembly protein CpaF